MGDQMFWLVGMIGSSLAIVGIIAFAYIREKRRNEPPAKKNQGQQ